MSGYLYIDSEFWLSDLSFTCYGQSDQMYNFFVQFLAIYGNKNLPNSI